MIFQKLIIDVAFLYATCFIWEVADVTTIPVVEPLFSFLCPLCYHITFILRPGNVSFKLSFLIPFSIISVNQLRFFVVYCTSYNLIAVGQSCDYVYFAMWFLLPRSFHFILILNDQRKMVNKKVGNKLRW